MPEGIGPWASGMRRHAGCPSNFESRALFVVKTPLSVD